ncbi:glycosyl hydrolase family 28-related protein [Telmatospirillum siberiense]|uniref:glycosyl hydrolase family 28-related protein n=1 Tax=Telmatospirillum siberiense TaxID=382514 RepID=UPI00130409A2|nr:glycosyl hydrolase family 28-related protein [Telmatospirillum siberiense]
MQTINDLFPPDIDVSKDTLRKGLVGPIVNVQGYGAQGDGLTDDRPAFVTAMAQGTGDPLLFPPGRYRIGSDLTFGPKLSLFFLPGATLVPDAGVIITIRCVLNAGAHAIFDLAADRSAVHGPMKVPYILPQWFGAVTEDTTAAARNVRALSAAWAALNTLNGMLLLPPGIYFVDDTVKFTNVVEGKNRNYSGCRIFGSGLISALESADFSGKAVVHIEGVELGAQTLCVCAATSETANSPAVGIAVTRTPDHRGGALNGTIDISGAFTHASYYNVSCENCNIQNSTLRNHGNGAVIWDSQKNLDGLTIASCTDSNTRKSFLGCNILSYSGKPATLVKMGWIAEFSFVNCYFFMESGTVFSDVDQGVEVNGLLIRECRCEINYKQSIEVKDNNRFLDIRHRLVATELAYVNFSSPGTLVWVEGGSIGSLHLNGNKITGHVSGSIRTPVRELKIINGGRVDDLTGFPRYAIEVTNGTGSSRLTHIDISSMLHPPIVGDGSYGLSESNRYMSRAGGYEKGPPRAQGELEALVSHSDSRAAVKVDKSTAFYVTGKTRLTWLSDTFSTHLITIVCTEGSLIVEHDAASPPTGFKPIYLAGETTFQAGPGAIIVLQNTFGGWREISRVAQARATIDWQPGGASGLAPGTGITSSAITVAGASFGDFVRVAAPYDLKDALLSAHITAPNQVKIRLQNPTSSQLTFSVGRWSVAVDK